MKTYIVAPYGYCNGVKAAINYAIEIHKEHPNESVKILGMLVHNKKAMDYLKEFNIESVYDDNKSLRELLDTIEGGNIIFTAHGHDHALEEQCKQKGITYFDSVCPLVKTIENSIRESLSLGHEVIYIGHPNHPESDAIKANFKNIQIIYSLDDIPNLKINLEKRYCIYNQSTLPVRPLRTYYKRIRARVAHMRIKNTSCPFAVKRQENIGKVPHDIELIYIIGDPHSNNTQELVDIARRRLKIKTIKINDVHDIKPIDLVGLNGVAIASGTSTPDYVVENVIDFLNNFNS